MYNNDIMNRKKKISPEISAYMARIGRKGAKSLHASSTPEKRSERCRKAVQERWRRYREKKHRDGMKP